MTIEPHLIFADVSLDIARGEFQSALDKLSKAVDTLPESYLLHLLHGRACRGMGHYDASVRHLKQCCRLAPSNQVAWQELIEVTVLQAQHRRESPAPASDPVADEFERLSIALSGFQPPRASECSDPTPVAEQKQPFPDDASIAVPTESLANIFIAQGAYKKAIRVYTSLIQLKPSRADDYRQSIDRLLEKL
jgi:tetratricopeptide (TPR) repeat protein